MYNFFSCFFWLHWFISKGLNNWDINKINNGMLYCNLLIMSFLRWRGGGWVCVFFQKVDTLFYLISTHSLISLQKLYPSSLIIHLWPERQSWWVSHPMLLFPHLKKLTVGAGRISHERTSIPKKLRPALELGMFLLFIIILFPFVLFVHME